jgi:hypothetical protein
MAYVERYRREHHARVVVVRDAIQEEGTPGSSNEGEAMKWKGMAATAALAAGALAGCGDPDHPALNPNPKQRYEITLKVEDAPGPFDSVTGFASYEIANPWECAPRDPISGVYVTAGYDADITLQAIGNNAYRGTVYLDLPVDRNYYLKGLCRWRFVSANVILKNHGVRFSTGLVLDEVVAQKTLTTYPQKRFYFGSKISDMDGSGGYMSEEIRVYPNDYFSMTISAKETAHE